MLLVMLLLTDVDDVVGRGSVGGVVGRGSVGGVVGGDDVLGGAVIVQGRGARGNLRLVLLAVGEGGMGLLQPCKERETKTGAGS